MTEDSFVQTRRRYLRAIGAVGIAGMAGCSGDGSSGDGSSDGGGSSNDGAGSGGETAGDGDTGSSGSADGDSGSADVTPWMTLHANPERTRSTPGGVPTNLSKVAEGSPPPVPPGGSDYFTLVTSDGAFHLGDSHVAGYEASNLDQKFVREFGGTTGAGRNFQGLRIIPGYVESGTLVAGVNDTLLGLSVGDGSREWIVEGPGIPFPTGDGIGLLTNSGLSVFEGDSQSVRWEKSFDRVFYLQTPVVHTESGTIFVAKRRTATLSAFDVASGEQQWSRSLPNDESAPVAVHGETLYVIDSNGALAIDRTDGSTQWEQRGLGVGLGLGERIPPYAVDEEGLYVLGDQILALDPSDGTERWSTPRSTGVLSMAAGAENLAYRGSDRLRVLSKTNGESQAAADVKGKKGGIAIAGGRIYVRQDEVNGRKLIAFGSG